MAQLGENLRTLVPASNRTLKAAVRQKGGSKKKKKSPKQGTAHRSTRNRPGGGGQPSPPPGIDARTHRMLQAITGMAWPYGAQVGVGGPVINIPDRTPRVFRMPGVRETLVAEPREMFLPSGGPSRPIAPSGPQPERRSVMTGGFGGGQVSAPAAPSVTGRGAASSPVYAAQNPNLAWMKPDSGEEGGILDFMSGPVKGVLDWSSRPASAVAYAATGDFKRAAQSAGEFAEPIVKYVGPQGPPISIYEAIRGDTLDLVPGKSPETKWMSETAFGEWLKKKAGGVPVIGGATSFGAGFALDIATDPLSWVGVGAGTTAARTAARRAAVQVAEKRARLVGYDPAEVPMSDLIRTAGEAQQAADKLAPHIDLNVRVPFSRTPVPWYGRNAEGKLRPTYKQLRQARHIGKTVGGARAGRQTGLGFTKTIRIPASLSRTTRYVRNLATVAKVDDELARKRAAVTGYFRMAAPKPKNFGEYLKQQRISLAQAGGHAVGTGQKMIRSMDKALGSTMTPMIRGGETAALLTGASGGVARDVAAAGAMGTKLINAVSSKFHNQYLQPIVKKLHQGKIDRHYFFRYMDDPTNPDYAPRAYAERVAPNNPERQNKIVQTVEEAAKLHRTMDERILRFARRNGLLKEGWGNYVPRYGKNAEAVRWLETNDYKGTRRGVASTPTRHGFEHERTHVTLRDAEDTYDMLKAREVSDVPWEVPKAARSSDKPYVSNIVETDYAVAMGRHISEVAMAAGDRAVFRGMAELRGGRRRPPTDLTERIAELEEIKAAQQAEMSVLTSRRTEDIASARVEAKQTATERREAQAELKGAEKAYHEAPGKRRQKVDQFMRKLAQLAETAKRRTSQGYNPADKRSYEVKHTRLRAEAEALARDLATLGDDTEGIVRAAMRAVKAADEGQAARAAQIVAITDRLIGEQASEAIRRLSIGAGLGTTGLSTIKVKQPVRYVYDFPVGQLPSRAKAARYFGVELQPTRVRGGERVARDIRARNAYKKEQARKSWILRADSVGSPEATAAQKRIHRTTFQKPEQNIYEQNTLRAERDITQVERETGDELLAAERALRQAQATRNRDLIRTASDRYREAVRAENRALRELGRVETARVGTMGQVRMQQRKIDTTNRQLQAARRKQVRFDKRRMTNTPMQDTTMEDWKAQIEQLKMSSDPADQVVAARAERTGYLMPEDARKGYMEWSSRMQYAMQTPAELRGISRAWAELQTKWKRFVLGSSRRIFRDTLEDMLLLAYEGVRDPSVLTDTMRILARAPHPGKDESLGTRGMRKMVGGLPGNGVRLDDGTFISDEVIRKQMILTGVTDMGQAQEAKRYSTVTTQGELGELGGWRATPRGQEGGFHSIPKPKGLSRGRMVSGLLAANQVRDNFARTALYIHRLKKGDDWITASRRVDTVFYDYANLNRQLMMLRRNVAPFITFLAKTLPNLARLGYEHPSYYSNMAKLATYAQQASGIPLNEMMQQQSPTSPNVIGVPSFPAMASWLAGGPTDEGVTWDPSAATRLSALNVFPIGRGGSDFGQTAALAAGQLLGGPAVDLFAGAVYNMDVRRGEQAGDYRNADPWTYNVLRGVGAALGDPNALAKVDRDPSSGDLRYRVNNRALSVLRAFHSYTPGTIGAFSYGPASLATKYAGVDTITRATEDGPGPLFGVIESPSQTARGRQRGISELTGINLRPQDARTALYYYLQRESRKR